MTWSCENLTDGPFNIAVSPNVSIVQVGNKLSCTADGNPPPTILWKSLGREDARRCEGELMISNEMVGSEQNWECTATVQAAGKTNATTIQISFAVETDIRM